MLKDSIKVLLQKILGYENYLFIFALFCIWRLYSSSYESCFKYFMKIIPENGKILDIGANIGLMSIALSKKFPSSEIYAFEPIPSNIQTFKRVMNRFRVRNVTLIESALGNVNGIIKMVLPVIKYSKRHGLSHVWQKGNNDEWNRGEIYSVQINRLDDLHLIKSAGKIAAVKVDVENYEFEVFSGAKELIAKHRPIIYSELWDNQKRESCIELFRKLDYAVKIVVHNELIDFTNQNDINFIFIPQKQ